MAIIFQQVPDTFTPSGNKMIYQTTTSLLLPNKIVYYDCEIYIGGVLIQKLKLYPFPTDGKQVIFDISQVLDSFGSNTFKPFITGVTDGLQTHDELLTKYNIRMREIYLNAGGETIVASWTTDIDRRVFKGRIDEISIAKWRGNLYFLNFLDLAGVVTPEDIVLRRFMNTFEKDAFKSVYEPTKEFLYFATNIRPHLFKMEVTARIDGVETRFYKYDSIPIVAGNQLTAIRYDVSPKFLFTEEQLEGLEIYSVSLQLHNATVELEGANVTYQQRYQYRKLNCIRSGNNVNFWFLNRFGVFESILTYCPKGRISTEATEMKINNYKKNSNNEYRNWRGDIDENEFVYNVAKYYLNTKSNLEYEVNTNNLDIQTQRWLGQITDAKICYQSIADMYYVPAQYLQTGYMLENPRIMEGENIKKLVFKLNEGFSEDYLENIEGLAPSLPIGFGITSFSWSID